MNTNILFCEKPLIINVQLAEIIGLNESIVVQQMHYWLEKSKHIINNAKWIYNTYGQWKEQFPFFSESTIRRIIKRLEDSNIIYSNNFNKSKLDNTKWYTINYDFFYNINEHLNSKKGSPSNGYSMTMDVQSDSLIIQNEHSTDQNDSMIHTICTDQMDNLSTPIPENTTETILRENYKEAAVKNTEIIPAAEEKNSTSTSETKTKEIDFKAICSFYNNNVHLLSPYQYTQLKELHDEFKDGELIIKAMELSIKNNAKGMRYIEVVLYDWRDKGISTAALAENYIKNLRKKGDKNAHGQQNSFSNKFNSSSHRKNAPSESTKWSGYKPSKPTFKDESIDCEGLI